MVCTEHYYEQILFVLLLAFLRPRDNIHHSSLRGDFHLREVVQVAKEHIVWDKNWMNLKIVKWDMHRHGTRRFLPSSLSSPPPLPASFPASLLPFHLWPLSLISLFPFLEFFFPLSWPFLPLSHSSSFLTPNSELESILETVADFRRECFAIQEGISRHAKSEIRDLWGI